MKSIFSWATWGAVSAVMLLPSQAAAQRSDAISQVAIVDLAYIYANHLRFQALTEDLKHEVEQAENDLKDKREQLQKMAEKLDEYKKNSPEFRELEEQITKFQVGLQADVTVRKKEFAEQEARNYYAVYVEVTDAIRRYCEQRGIVLVLRFNGDPIDADNSQDIAKALNNMVLHYHKEIDITPHILAMVNPKGPRRTVDPGTANGPGKKAGVPPRQ